jgi:hypothetical protein
MGSQLAVYLEATRILCFVSLRLNKNGFVFSTALTGGGAKHFSG